MDEMNVSLQEWINSNAPKEEMYYCRAWSNQVCFVRDDIPKFLINNYDYSIYATIRDNITVISTHTSKSVKLPVYRIKAFGSTYIIRGNFHNWMISVESGNEEIKVDFKKLGVIHSDVGKINSIYCEGFKEEWVYDSWDNNKWKFTIELGTRDDVMIFFWLISHSNLIWEK